MSDAEVLMFSDTFQEHSQRELSARLADMWVAANQPVPQLCEHRAMVRRGCDVEDDEISAASVADEELAGIVPEDPGEALDRQLTTRNARMEGAASEVSHCSADDAVDVGS